MISFIKGVFYDLSFRISKMITDLENRKQNNLLHSDIPDSFYQNTIKQLSGLRNEIQVITTSGDLDIESIASNNLIRYNTIFEKFQSIELFRYQVIINYGPAEHYFNKKIKRIYAEIKNSQTPPLVTTISNSESYYWAHPYFAIIAVPLGEEKNLLNLPDLYHEICHFIYKHYAKYLIGNFLDTVQKYFDDEIERVIEEHRAARYISFYRDKLQKWLNGWIEEFTCDLVATFLVGPAYAWTNLKLSTISSGNDRIYIDNPSHPSDEARMRAIFHMLDITGQGAVAVKIKDSWNKFLVATANPIPPDYKFIFPEHLLEQLANTVLEGCRAIGLNDYESQITEFGNPISKILNDAWDVLLKDPSGFDAWEVDAINEIANSK
jgi:hypothetical protein